MLQGKLQILALDQRLSNRAEAFHNETMNLGVLTETLSPIIQCKYSLLL